MSDPLDCIKRNDKSLYDSVNATRKMAFEDGILSAKTKLLIALAIDITKYAKKGIEHLSLAALEHGATKEEIFEVLRIAYFICGAGTTYTAASVLKDIFKE